VNRPSREHTELEEELYHHAHIDYDRVAIIANPSVAALYEDALVYETGSAMTSTGALTAYSGAKTGRSPSDKRVVKEPSSEKDVWWGPVNKEMSTEVSCLHFPSLARIPRMFCKSGIVCRTQHDVRHTSQSPSRPTGCEEVCSRIDLWPNTRIPRKHTTKCHGCTCRLPTWQ